jgi:CRP-like cAMP-binding protein
MDAEVARIKGALLKHGTHRSYDELLLLKAYLAKSDFVKNTLSVGLFPKQLDELCRSLVLESVEAGDRIIRQNAVADKMCIVLTGACDIKVKQKVSLAHGESEVRDKTVYTCTAGMHFGERALMNDEPRAASVIAKEASDLITITKITYNALLKGAVADSHAQLTKSEQPGTKAHLMKVLGKNREDRTKLEIESVASYLSWRIPFFEQFTPEQQLELCRVSEAVSIWGETVLFKQGSIGEAFYVVLTGSVEVWVATNDEVTIMNTMAMSAMTKGGSALASSNAGVVKPLKTGLGTKVASLGVGDTFGERALENEDSMRMASIVTCQSCTDLLVISREDYHKLISALTNTELMKKITLLRKTDMFRNVDGDHLREMARFMVATRYEVDDYLFEAGTKATQMIVIETGEVMVEVEVKTYTTNTVNRAITEGDESDDASQLTDVNMDMRAKLRDVETLDLGRLAPFSILAPYVTQAATAGERIEHPESIRATTLVKAYTLGVHDFYSNMKRESMLEIVQIAANHTRSSIPALWEQVPLRFGQKEWHRAVAWKKYKENLRDKNKTITYNEALKIYANMFITPHSGNVHQNRHGAVSKIHSPDFIISLEQDGKAFLTESDMLYTADIGAHLHDDEMSTYSVDSATLLRKQVTSSWGLKKMEKARPSASNQLGIDITSTHPVVAKALEASAKRDKQRKLDNIRGASAMSSTPASSIKDLDGEESLATKMTLSTGGSMVANLKGGEGNEDIRRFAFSLIHLHQENHHATPASTGFNRLLSMHLRHCGTMKSCDSAKRAADKQMQEALILLFGSDLSKAGQLVLKWRAFTGFESLALDNSDIVIVYCRSVPVEYACLNPERNLLDMPFPSFCKQKRQFYSCMRMKTIHMPKVVAPDVESSIISSRRKKKKKKKPNTVNEYGIEYVDTDDDGSDDESKVQAHERRLLAEGLPSTSQYKQDQFNLQMAQPLMLHELSSFAETLATSTTHEGSLRYGKTFEASQEKKDPFTVLVNTSLPHDLFHPSTSSANDPIMTASLSRPGTKGDGGAKKSVCLLDGNSMVLSPKPNVGKKDDTEYICVLPLYQWIILEESTLRKYDITKIRSDDPSLPSVMPDSLVPGFDVPQSRPESPVAVVDLENRSKQRRLARLQGRDCVDTAFFEAGMINMRDKTTNNSAPLPAVEPSVIKDLEKNLATKDLAKTVDKFHAQEIEDEILVKERRKNRALMRKSSLAYGSLASLSIDTIDTTSTAGQSQTTGGMQQKSTMRSPGHSHHGHEPPGDASPSEDKTMDFVLTAEKAQALTDVMKERVRMIRMNDVLCRDEGKLNPKKKKVSNVLQGGSADDASGSDDDDSLYAISANSAPDNMASSRPDAAAPQNHKRGVTYIGNASKSGAFEPGGMGLLSQRMNMYEALNHLSASRSVVEKELIRSKSLSALNGKRSKFGSSGGSVRSNPTDDASSVNSGGSGRLHGSGSSDAFLRSATLSKNLHTLDRISSMPRL